MKRMILAVALLGLLLPAIATAAPPPKQVPVPADFIAAHPGGHAIDGTASATSSTSSGGKTAPLPDNGSSGGQFGPGCYRLYLAATDNSGLFGNAEEHFNPLWCESRGLTGGADVSWHYPVCTGAVSCQGENGPYQWTGCAYYCSSVGYGVDGYFSGFGGIYFNWQLHVACQLYGNGQWWAYTWETN